MATGITGFDNLTPAQRDAFQRVLLDTAAQDQVFSQFAEESTIDKNNGDRWLARRYDPYPVITLPTQDAVIGSPRRPTYSDIRMALDFYEDYTEITKKAQYTNLEDATKKISELHGQQAGESIDTLYRNVLNSGASSVSASNGGNGGNGGSPTNGVYADYQAVVKMLRKTKAKMIAPMRGGSGNFNTSPTSAGYICFFHSDLRDDIRNLDTFVPVHMYGGAAKYTGEFGAMDDIIFIESNNGYVSGGTYSNFIIGQKFYGGTYLSGETVNIYRKAFGSAGTNDPTNKLATVGWDMMWGGGVQQDAWGSTLLVTHS